MLNLAKQTQKGLAALTILTAMMATGCGGGSSSKNNPPVSNVQYSVQYINGYFLSTLTFPALTINAGGRIIPDPKNLPNSYVEITPNLANNGTVITVGLDLVDVQKAMGVSPFSPDTLPGGRPLPTVGSLPGFAFAIDQGSFKNWALYFGAGTFGLFVPVSLGVKDIMGTFALYSSGTSIGQISIIGQGSTANDPSGILLLISKTSVNAAGIPL